MRSIAASSSTTSLQTGAPRHLRARRMRRASRHLLRPGRAGLRAGAGAGAASRRAARPRYDGSVVATNLKVSGVSVFSAGDFLGGEGSEAIVLSDIRRGTYKKLVISEGRLTGAVLVGDIADALWYLELIRKRRADRANSQGHDVRPRRRRIRRRGGMTGSCPHDRPRSRLARHPHRLSLLRRRLRRAGDAGRSWRRCDLRRSRASREFRTAVFERLRARRNARA